jgi:hypothetical protein
MYCKKGLVIPVLGTVLIIITIISLMFVGAFSSSMEGGIIQKGGKAISLSNYVEFWKKSIDESSKIIFMRTAYDLGKTGGMESLDVPIWNSTYLSIGFLREELENRINENLPKSSIGSGKIVKFGEGNIHINLNILDGDVNYDGDVDNDDLNICVAAYGSSPGDLNWNPDCDFNYDKTIDILDAVLLVRNLGKSGPTLSDSKNFLVKGNKSFSIYDKSIDSTAYASNVFNSNASSSYFKLIYVGRKIVEDPSYSSLLNDMTALKNKLQTDFPNLDFELELSTTDTSENGLVGYWTFDEGVGNIVKDASNNGNDGTLINGPQWISGKYGSALKFDGSNKYVEIPDDPSLRAENNKITIELWFKRDKVPTGVQCLINKIGDGPDTVFTDYNVTYYISVPSSGSSSGGVITEFNSQFSYFIAYGSYSFTESVDFGLIRDYNWHHLAETYDGNILKSYLDGSIISTKVTTTKKMPLNDQPVRIGGENIFHNQFNGTIDEVKIYNRALSEDEIKGDYESLPQRNVIEVTITDKSCLPDNYCLAPLKKGEAGIIVGGKQIPYDYLKLKFKALDGFGIPLGGDFGFSVSPSDNIIVQGNTATPTVNVFGVSTAAITLSIIGCPAGSMCQFVPNARVPPFSSILTITNAPIGTHTMTVYGTNGTTTHSKPYSLTVTPVACRCSPGTPDETNCGSCAGAATSKQPSWCDAMGNWVSDQCGAIRHDCSCPLGKTCNAATGACCTPTTCSALGKNCGSWPDGCGNILNCGTCLAGQACNNGVCCSPKTCSDYPGQCGSLSDGCGGTIICGLSCDDSNPCTNDFCSGNTCTHTNLPDGTLCDGPGKTCQSGICICVPKTCVNYPGQCGSLSDGCGGIITCNCPLGENCVSGTCVPSCIPTTCAALGKNCGSWSDGCGGTLNCGTCTLPQTCSNGVCVCQCSDGTPCGQCAITDAFKPSWCDNNGNWVANQCNAPHSCQCPGASPICKLDGSCKPRGMGCFCDWNMEFSCGLSPNTHAECRIAIWWYAWWKKCECEDSVGDPNPGCGQIYGITCGGFPEYTEICRNSLWPFSDPACECTSCPS